MTTPPFVRLVVVNYDGGDFTLACLGSLARLDWPADRREVWLVDNASSDGVVERVGGEPGVRVIRNGTNVGFGAACNMAMVDLDGVDYVALVNNDAVVAPGWLSPLVAALEDDPRAGAANGKVLFDPKFAELTVESETFIPGKGDRRRLGVRVSGVRVDGMDVSERARFVGGFWTNERGEGDEQSFRWTNGRGEMLVPAPAPASPLASGSAPVPPPALSSGDHPRTCQLRLATAGTRAVTIVTPAGRAQYQLDNRPRWYDVPPLAGWTDVVNSAGAELLAGGYGPERGFLEPDRGQYEEPVEVFAWTGSAVVLAARYLADAGGFDPRLFLYYEDFDLSWRGRLLGWRYHYVPQAVARHVHSAATGRIPEQVLHYVERNRLLVLTRNAPLAMVGSALVGFAIVTVNSAAREAWNSFRITKRLSADTLRQRATVLADYLRLVPETVAERRAIRRRRRVDDRDILEWQLSRPRR